MALRWAVATAALLAWSPGAIAQTVGTAFTYQGRLNSAGTPANGLYNFQFSLFSQATDGSALPGSPLTLTNVSVSSGLFTVTLDFGAAFTGSPRWLEVAVQPAGGGSFTALTPRQELKPAPNAVFSQTVPWGGISGAPPSLVTNVVNGGGVTGSVVSNTLTLGSDSTVQRRSAGNSFDCPAGQYLRAVAADGTPTCIADATGWGLTGNTAIAGTHFLGTTNNVALDIKVNGVRALRLAPNATSPNILGGFEFNSVFAGVAGAVVGGGGAASPFENRVADDFGVVAGGGGNRAGDGFGTTSDRAYATVGGGSRNTATALYSTVAGGSNNQASAENSTVAGGSNNQASAEKSTVAGGEGNRASAEGSAVSGGESNRASGIRAFVGGGYNNQASGISATVGGGAQNLAYGSSSTVAGGGVNLAGGNLSFAAGFRAKSRSSDPTSPYYSGDADGDEGAFVWADAQGGDFISTGPNQFLIRSGGGVGINRNNPAPGSLDVNGPAIVTGFRLTTLPAAGHVLTSDAGGNGTWQPLTTAAWGIGGNTGTTPGTNFLGTTDGAALELRVNNVSALRLMPNATSPSIVGGYSGNSATGVAGAVIAGGGYGSDPNTVSADFGTVGGGATNTASGVAATVGGGSTNRATSLYATVGGGTNNTASNEHATVAGGQSNTASGTRSTVAGGYGNEATGENSAVGGGIGNAASGAHSTIPGGWDNFAGGSYSLAAGRRAWTRDATMVGGGDLDGDEGTFVWADSAVPAFISTGPNQFLIRSAGGVGINKNNPAPGALDVNGPAIMTGFRLTSPTLAGHVLTSDATGNGLWQPPALGNDWRLGGNAGTNPATDFLGTTDNAALELRVNNVRALRLEPNAESPNVVGGFNGNTVTSGVAGAVIGGGGAASPYFNRVTDGYGVVGGGAQNRAGNDNGDPLDARFATVGGGFVNTASGDRSTVGGGDFNRAAGPYSTTGGGYDNAASGEYSTIAGGSNNRAIGDYSTVAGGISNRAGGSYSFAAGLGARVRDAAQSGDLDGDENTFVWGGGGGVFTSTGPNQFLIRSVGGVGINKNNPAAGALDVNGNVLSSGDVISTGLVRTAGGVAISAGASPAGQLQMGEPANFSAFRFGGSSARHHLISNRDMVFNTYDLDGVVNGQPLYYWRRNPTQFDENAAPVTLMTLADDGSLSVTGTLSKGGGSFKIDHPLDPENKFLYHSFVESPDMMNIYNGLVTTNAEGLAVVEMPTWFEALNRDFRYQLTVIGDGAWARARVFKRIACGRFTIQTDLPNVEVSWQVTGIRQDAFAEQNRIPVEQDKPANQRGTLLYPGAASNR